LKASAGSRRDNMARDTPLNIATRGRTSPSAAGRTRAKEIWRPANKNAYPADKPKLVDHPPSVHRDRAISAPQGKSAAHSSERSTTLASIRARHDNGDIVDAPPGQRQLHQRVGRGLGGRMLDQDPEHVVFIQQRT